RGAGKLPTASAVVSDVVDCARHIGKVIMCFWDAQDAKLTGIGEAKGRFFVRVREEKERQALQIFEQVSVIEADVPGEFAFITQSMTEKEFNQKAEETGIISRIRVEE
ncbi:MAG: homoserine dehydrogenase, partial [Acetatifactor sp.]|nr:homoserine dehydrogenase [Acetatifactor sp.]